jgi:hypothetical protein
MHIIVAVTDVVLCHIFACSYLKQSWDNIAIK